MPKRECLIRSRECCYLLVLQKSDDLHKEPSQYQQTESGVGAGFFEYERVGCSWWEYHRAQVLEGKFNKEN